jgi:phage major head subunit gpT-like protein
MDIRNNPELVNLFFKQIIEPKFSDAYNKALETLILNKVGMQMESNGESTIHGWMNQIDRMKEWVGPRVISNVSLNGLEVVNRIFQNAIAIPRKSFDADSHGLYANNAAYLGNDAAFNKDRLLIEAMLRGSSTKWADGINAFDGSSNRKFDGTNAINNYGTDSLDQAGVNLASAYAKMTSYVGHGGQPLMVQPKYLVHGPQLRIRAFQNLKSGSYFTLAADNTTYVTAGANPNQGLLESLETPLPVNGFVDSKGTSYNAAYYWAIIGEVVGLKPLVYQNWKEPEFQDARVSPNSEWAFANDEFQWGVRSAGEAFIGLPWLMYFNAATA